MEPESFNKIYNAMQELGRRVTRLGAAMPSFGQYVELARGLACDLAIYLYCKTLYYAWPSKLRYLRWLCLYF